MTPSPVDIDRQQLRSPPSARLAGLVLRLCLAGCLTLRGLAVALPSLTLDTDFRPSFTTTRGVEVTAVALQSEGTLMVAGRFDLFHGHAFNGLVRLDTAGRVDPGFALWPCVQGTVYAVAVQRDGRILIGGDFDRVAGEARSGLARLDPHGGLDGSFAPEVEGDRSCVVRVLRTLPDGRILVGGDFRKVGHRPRSCVARLFPNGALDETFDPGEGVEDAFGVVRDLAPLPNGGMVVAGLFTKFDGQRSPGLVELDAHGRVNPLFAPALDWSQGLVNVTVVRRQENGRLLLAGRFDRVGGEPRPGLARLRESGVVDEGFEVSGGWFDVSTDPVRDLVIQGDGRIVVTGSFEQLEDRPLPGLARLLPNGAVDASFEPGPGLQDSAGGVGAGVALALQKDGCLIIAGMFNQVGDEPRHLVARLLPDGSLDRSYSDPAGLVERVGTVNTLAVQPDGRILVGGDFERAHGEPCHALARILPHGSVDRTFDAHIKPGGVINALALQPGGEILAGGLFAVEGDHCGPNLARFLDNGQCDAAFEAGAGPNGEVYCLALGPEGEVVLGGRFDVVNGESHDLLARLSATGAVDSGFAPRLGVRVDTPDVYSVAVQQDGRVIIGGYFDSVNEQARTGLARLARDGSLDLGFGRRGLIGGDLPVVTGIGLKADGALVLAGSFTLVDGEPRHGVARLDPDGRLDRGFDPGAGVEGGELPAVYGLALGRDSQSVIVGEFRTVNRAPRLNLARLAGNGALDSAFAPQGCMDGWAQAAAIDDAGNILVGGPFSIIASEPRQGLARFRSGPPSPARVNITRDAAATSVIWDGTGTLQSSASPVGPWRDEPGLPSPAALQCDQPARFFRVVR